jgi:ribonuclease P protein component
VKSLALPRRNRTSGTPRHGVRTRYKYSVGNDLLRLAANPSPLPNFRIAVAASKSTGPAVTRNRLKRFAREILRIHQAKLAPKTDYLLIFTPVSPKKKSDKSILYKNLRFADLQPMILALLDRLTAKMTGTK